MPSPRLKIMLWNVENLFIFIDKHDNIDFSSITESHWQSLSHSSQHNKTLKKIWGLVKNIEYKNPDIILLNEVGGLESLENFNNLFLQNNYDVRLIEGNSDRGIDVGYLTKKNLPYSFELKTNKNRKIPLKYKHDSDDSTYFLSRDIAHLEVSHQNQLHLSILLTHLKSKLDLEKIDPEGLTRRTAEAHLLSEIYNEEQSKNPEVPCLVTGDFNGVFSDPFHTEFKLLRNSTDLIDVLDLTPIKDEKRMTQVIFKNGHKFTYQFDHILIGKKFSELINKDETEVFYLLNDLDLVGQPPTSYEEKIRLPSDHFPVCTEVQLPSLEKDSQ